MDTVDVIQPDSRRLPWGANILRKAGKDPYVAEASSLVKGMNAKQALKKAGMGFTVVRTDGKAPAQTLDGNKMPAVGIDGKWFARRSDTGAVLGFLGPDHEVLQPFEMAEFVDLLVDTEKSSLAGMGMTKHDDGPDAQFSTKMYFVVKLDEPIKPNGMPKEATDVFLMLSNAWDSSQSLTGSIVPMRLACTNGLTYPMKGEVMTWRIRHSRQMKQKMVAVQSSMQNLAGWAETMRVDIEALMDKSIPEDAIDVVVDVLLPVVKPKTDDDGKVLNGAAITIREGWRSNFTGVWLESPTLEKETRMTAWGAMNAWSEWKQWGRPDLKMDPMNRLLGAGLIDAQLPRVRKQLVDLKL